MKMPGIAMAIIGIAIYSLSNGILVTVQVTKKEPFTSTHNPILVPSEKSSRYYRDIATMTASPPVVSSRQIEFSQR